jgi:hypothetical protein
MTMPEPFLDRYRRALVGYLQNRNETGLVSAEALGRQALTEDLGVLATVELHHQVLSELAPAEMGAAEGGQQAALEFLLQALAALEVASRGFVEAQNRLLIEQQHLRQLHGLAQASQDIHARFRLEDQLEAVAAAAAHLLGASGSTAAIDLGDGWQATTPIPSEAVGAVAKLRVAEGPVEHSWSEGARLMHWLGANLTLVGAGLPPCSGLVAVWRVGDPYTAFEAALLTQLADTAAIGVVNTRLYQREHDAALALQRSLLPRALTPISQIELCARYRAASPAFGVGGDWYDVVQLPGGRVGLIVGDVMGHGVMAAAVMGQLRVAVRAYALEGHSPGTVLARVEPLHQELAGDRIATVVYAILDPDGSVHFANAGHPPPLVVSQQGNRLISDALSPPLGAVTADTAREEHLTRMSAGSTLVLYTDGLLERRNRPIDDGLALLLAALRNPAESLEHLCDRAIQVLVGPQNEDDVCILAARPSGPGQHG